MYVYFWSYQRWHPKMCFLSEKGIPKNGTSRTCIYGSYSLLAQILNFLWKKYVYLKWNGYCKLYLSMGVSVTSARDGGSLLSLWTFRCSIWSTTISSQENWLNLGRQIGLIVLPRSNWVNRLAIIRYKSIICFLSSPLWLYIVKTRNGYTRRPWKAP